MSLFKYLEPCWADQMVGVGATRIGTLYDFRRIESLDAERGDKDEGVRISLTDGNEGLIAGEDLPWFVRESLRIPPGIKLQFEKGAVFEVHQSSPDAYVFCMCSKFDQSIMQRFGGACVEIVDPARYFAAARQSLDGWTADGVRKISGFQLAPCQYVAREQTWPDVIPYDPIFRKPLAYSHQCEIRAAWGTRVAPLVPVNLVVPDIRAWCRRIA
jgi:hypothetical protein